MSHLSVKICSQIGNCIQSDSASLHGHVLNEADVSREERKFEYFNCKEVISNS